MSPPSGFYRLADCRVCGIATEEGLSYRIKTQIPDKTIEVKGSDPVGIRITNWGIDEFRSNQLSYVFESLECTCYWESNEDSDPEEVIIPRGRAINHGNLLAYTIIFLLLSLLMDVHLKDRSFQLTKTDI
ncbi:uncharacterized protein RJT20DRAFT_134869 [Scheffersomyces xylosifermentans]|uniref:uncharacterized protein n=1 Tax=Scheffersomyces xylosifermentans TaxID=1304137 RepID=UPI00315DF329